MRRRRRDTLLETLAERIKRHMENEQSAERRYNEKQRIENELMKNTARWRLHVSAEQPFAVSK